ncbi:MAG: nuclear transport factor 2 family protein [Actinomycetota bacterium]
MFQSDAARPLRNPIGVAAAIVALVLVATACSSAGSDESVSDAAGLESLPVACWGAAADGSYDDFEASVALFEGCTTEDYSFAVVNPALGEIVCFRDGGFCPLEQPGLTRPAVRLSGFAAGAARGEIGARHQITNIVVEPVDESNAVIAFRSTAFYFNQDGSHEIGWGDHELAVVREGDTWKIDREDVFIPNPNQRIVADERG